MAKRHRRQGAGSHLIHRRQAGVDYCGASSDVVEASWIRLVDSIEYKLIKDAEDILLGNWSQSSGRKRQTAAEWENEEWRPGFALFSAENGGRPKAFSRLGLCLPARIFHSLSLQDLFYKRNKVNPRGLFRRLAGSVRGTTRRKENVNAVSKIFRDYPRDFAAVGALPENGKIDLAFTPNTM